MELNYLLSTASDVQVDDEGLDPLYNLNWSGEDEDQSGFDYEGDYNLAD